MDVLILLQSILQDTVTTSCPFLKWRTPSLSPAFYLPEYNQNKYLCLCPLESVCDLIGLYIQEYYLQGYRLYAFLILLNITRLISKQTISRNNVICTSSHFHKLGMRIFSPKKFLSAIFIAHFLIFYDYKGGACYLILIFLFNLKKCKYLFLDIHLSTNFVYALT